MLQNHEVVSKSKYIYQKIAYKNNEVKIQSWSKMQCLYHTGIGSSVTPRPLAGFHPSFGHIIVLLHDIGPPGYFSLGVLEAFIRG